MKEYLKEKFKLNLSFGWKGHIIQFHLEEFLNKIQKPLGFFAEQTSESVHKNMKKTLSRFCVSETHTSHGAKLHKSVVIYSSM